MLCKDDERDGYECEYDFAHACPSDCGCNAVGRGADRFADVARDEFFDCFDESKVGIVKEGLEFCAYARS